MPVVCRRLRTPGGSEIVSWIIQCEVCEAWIPTGSNVADYGWQKISVGRENGNVRLVLLPGASGGRETDQDVWRIRWQGK